MPRTSFPLLLLLLLLFQGGESGELTRCCAGGVRHFRQSSTCSSIKAEGTSMTCQRTASICCLRTLLESSCDEGYEVARLGDACPSNVNVLGGGLRKECCDCCVLAKELVLRNENCVAPTGFSAACLRSFNKCCKGPIEFTDVSEIITGKPTIDTVMHVGDRCATANCEHLCHDRGGDNVECSCRAGFDLASDGMACVDKNECLLREAVCAPSEFCVNTLGGYQCQRRASRYAPSTLPRVDNNRRPQRGREREAWRPLNDAPVADVVVACARGWVAVRGRCVDVDECRLLMDDCLESQRCLNLPGSFKCIRTLSCGTGYAMNSNTEECMDVDECNLGSHDCGPTYQCKNTQGSYRCVAKKCGDGELQNPQTGECTSIECPQGYYAKNQMCNDVDECATGNRCSPSEECVNTPGSFRCQQRGNLCTHGFEVNVATGFCEDVDECAQGVCGPMQCTNVLGSYKCKCGSGFDFNDATKRCEDIDECKKFEGHVCDLSATCTNTIGSFECKCKEGFQLAPDGRRCEDVNECTNGLARCEQKCVNIPGSFQCICERGFALGRDGVQCEDIDECEIWSGSGNELCMGGCVNTKGSYLCKCPHGYKIQADGRTCVDIDECLADECGGPERVCVNTLGSFKCHHIECPLNYAHDLNNKNRCNRMSCGLPEECSRMPLYITWQFISLARAVPISSHRPAITLFKVSAPNQPDTDVQFELHLKRAVAEQPHVLTAIRPNFLLQKGDKRNSAVVTLRDSLDGPQTVQLQLVLRVSRRGASINSYAANLVIDVQVQDGFSCIKTCGSDDTACMGNHTREILYQFRAIPTMHEIKIPLEVSRIHTHMHVPFSVDYSLDSIGLRHFEIRQERNIGIVQLVKPIVGPTTTTIRVNIHTKSRTGVILAFNFAVIEVHVSRHSF